MLRNTSRGKAQYPRDLVPPNIPQAPVQIHQPHHLLLALWVDWVGLIANLVVVVDLHRRSQDLTRRHGRQLLQGTYNRLIVRHSGTLI